MQQTRIIKYDTLNRDAQKSSYRKEFHILYLGLMQQFLILCFVVTGVDQGASGKYVSSQFMKHFQLQLKKKDGVDQQVGCLCYFPASYNF